MKIFLSSFIVPDYRRYQIICLFLQENIFCGYSLEALRRGASHEYPERIFSSRNRNKYFVSYIIVVKA